MNKNIAKIRAKLVCPEDFFKEVAEDFRSKGLKRFYFLMSDQKKDLFVTKYSTNGRRICLTKNELLVLIHDIKKEIFLLQADFKCESYSIIRKALLIKVRWKIKLFKICAIMPIYNNNKVVCLILFGDKFVDAWLNKHGGYIKNIKQDIEYCIASILFYNQTLERIIREYNECN